MAVSVLLGLPDFLLAGRLRILWGVGGCQWRFVGGGVGRAELRELRVVVAVVTGDGGPVGVLMRERERERACGRSCLAH